MEGPSYTSASDKIRGIAPPATPVSDDCCLSIDFGCGLYRKEAFFRFCWIPTRFMAVFSKLEKLVEEFRRGLTKSPIPGLFGSPM